MRIPALTADLAGLIAHGVDRRTFGRVADLQIELADRAVVLKGRTKTYYTKQLAQLGAMDVLADHPIVNQITVG